MATHEKATVPGNVVGSDEPPSCHQLQNLPITSECEPWRPRNTARLAAIMGATRESKGAVTTIHVRRGATAPTFYSWVHTSALS